WLRVPRTRHEGGSWNEGTSGQETNKKALAIHVSGLLYERRSWNEGTAGLRSQTGARKHDDPRSPWKEWLLLDFKQYRTLYRPYVSYFTLSIRANRSRQRQCDTQRPADTPITSISGRDVSGDLLPPPPPAEQANACQ